MFNLGIIVVNLAALSIMANCNYLHIDHCHMRGAIKASSVCEWKNIQSKCHMRHEQHPEAVIEQESRPGCPTLMASVPRWAGWL